MSRFAFVLALLAFATYTYAADTQAHLSVRAETKLMQIPGMPKMPKIPGMADIQLPGEPMRSLDILLWSPGVAPKDASAVVIPQKALKQGNKLELEVFPPDEAKKQAMLDGHLEDETATETDEKINFTIKVYWGSSEKVREGQPKIIKLEDIGAQNQKTLQQQKKQIKELQSASDFYRPDWTTAHWPTKKQPGKISMDASLSGLFTLNTNYTGNVSIDIPNNVDFLDPITLVSPDMGKKVGLDDVIRLQWNAIDNALGFHASIFGTQGEDTIIIWTSSEIYEQENDLWAGEDFIQMADVNKMVKEKRFMPGDATSVTVPEGIFSECNGAILNMAGYGRGVALSKGQPLPRVQTKTSLTVMLGTMGPGADMDDKYYDDIDIDLEEIEAPPAPPDISDLLKNLELPSF